MQRAPNSLTDWPTLRPFAFMISRTALQIGRRDGQKDFAESEIGGPPVRPPGLSALPALPRGSSASLDLRVFDAVWRGQQHCRAGARNRGWLDAGLTSCRSLHIRAVVLARIADDGRTREPSAIGGGWAPPTPTTPPSVLAVQLALILAAQKLLPSSTGDCTPCCRRCFARAKLRASTTTKRQTYT
jgi:hypothetical protein